MLIMIGAHLRSDAVSKIGAPFRYYDRMYDHARRLHPSTVIVVDGTNATFEEIAARLLDMHRTATS